MNTTNLFVELMVIGIGALSAIFLAVAAFIDFGAERWTSPNNDNVVAILILAPILALTYVLGIIIDRGADWLFRTLWADSLRRRFFANDIDAYHRARRAVLAGPPKLAALLEYARSRMRICRGWTVNAAFLVVAWNLFAARQLVDTSSSGSWWLAGNLFFLALLVGSWVAWRSLILGIYEKAQRLYAFLCEQHLVAMPAGNGASVEDGFEEGLTE